MKFKDNKYEANVKLEVELSKFRRKCKNCGWYNIVANKYGKEICKNCGKYVYLDDKHEFVDKMKGKLK